MFVATIKNRNLILIALLLSVRLSATVHAYRLVAQPWRNTASGSAGPLGSPITLTWGFAPDGTDTFVKNVGFSGGSTIPDGNALNFLDGVFGVTNGGSDLTTRPWFPHFQSSFDRVSELTGVDFVYEPNDDGTTVGITQGRLGVRADVRINGHILPGASQAAALIPEQGGGLLLNTDPINAAYYTSPDRSHLNFRNTMMHEIGHTLGMQHVDSLVSQFLMELPFDPTIDGPQLDDIRGMHRLFGDTYERHGGFTNNDSSSTATELGVLVDDTTVVIGSDANDQTFVLPDQVDFASLDNNQDVDVFRIVLDQPMDVAFSLEPLGASYTASPSSEFEPESVDTSAISDLNLTLVGDQTFEFENEGRLGESELLTVEGMQSGDYFIHVDSLVGLNSVQLYRLEIHATATVPEPAISTLIMAALISLITRSRRSARANFTVVWPPSAVSGNKWSP